MQGGFYLAEKISPLLLNTMGVVSDAATTSPAVISGIPVAILLGLAIRNLSPSGLPQILTPGLAFAQNNMLKLGDAKIKKIKPNQKPPN